ncbi:SPL family radical SAM protein [Vulcanibacillus modesticaldus]|uniref:SPL family radical SAM protein n=1 Tax=Vulcanibacillus modesticaldus TaxID=337097 RepID=UPI000A9BFCCE|nr:hypothetical protein [Vulcanibacillus modesticaldus]
MNRSKNDFFLNNFSHIYIEKEILDHHLTKRILNRFPKAKVIEIEHYKDVFNRSKQNFFLQKNSQKLILAKKKDNFIYPGAEVCHDFGNQHFYYTASILNCIYHCDYCYLQGMFSSSNIVIFVNIEDFLTELKQQLKKHPVYLAISYDTDLLALENIVPFASTWIEFATDQPDLSIEIRTKSVNYSAIKHLSPADNVILAWTISPEEVVQQYERGTPSLEARLNSIKQAIDDGWKVRLSFDPILHIENWKKHYKECIDKTFNVLPINKIEDASIGVFRMPKDYLKSIKKHRSDSALLYYSFEIKNGVVSYSDEITNMLVKEIYQMINNYIPADKIFI